MDLIYATYPETARFEIDQRLRDADGARRRRLARGRVTSPRHGRFARARRLSW